MLCRLPASETLHQAALLRVVRNPQQGREEQEQRTQKVAHTTSTLPRQTSGTQYYPAFNASQANIRYTIHTRVILTETSAAGLIIFKLFCQ